MPTEAKESNQPNDRDVGDQPLVMRLTVDLTIEPIMGQRVNSTDKDELHWFNDQVLGDPNLILHSNLIGDTLGTVKVVSTKSDERSQ